jgi:hypothetical protein
MHRAWKNRLSATLLAMTALVLAPAAGHAVTGDISIVNVLNTSLLLADTASLWDCNVVNVSTSKLSVTIELISSFGNVLASNTFSLAAGTSMGLTVPGTSGFARCRVSLDFDPNAIRANLAVTYAANGIVQTFATSEAR